MGPVLILTVPCLAALGALAVGAAYAGDAASDAAHGDRHEWRLQLDANWAAPSTPLGAWPGAGLGKLRYDEDDRGLKAARVFVDWRVRLKPGVTAHLVADYIDDEAGGADVTEAYVEWRPVPRSSNRHRFRAGAFYPPLSLENGGPAWSSPFGLSFSAVNTWLGEEIRPVGVEWSMRRRLGLGSPHELGAFASGFYGNDPAGTLLFYRGWSLHDRQSRLGDRLPMPPAPVWQNGAVIGHTPQKLRPFHEIDHEPGAYAGLEWRYARRGLVQLSHYDNRADPNAYAGGQWGWRTAFDQLGVQIALPYDFGLLAQWLRGDTSWLIATTPDGRRTPFTELVEDRFDAKFVMLTRRLRGRHRLSLRYDDFEVRRHESAPALQVDDGHAWTLAYRFERPASFDVVAEWQEIVSRRDLWTDFYGLAPTATERMLAVRLSWHTGSPGR